MSGSLGICPLCGLESITPDQERCPQCDADLICFRVLDSLPDQLPTAQHELLPHSSPLVKTGGNTQRDILVVGGLIVLVLGLLLGPLLLRFADFATRMEEQSRALVSTLKGLDLTLAKLSGDHQLLVPAGKGDTVVQTPHLESKPETKPEPKPEMTAEATPGITPVATTTNLKAATPPGGSPGVEPVATLAPGESVAEGAGSEGPIRIETPSSALPEKPAKSRAQQVSHPLAIPSRPQAKSVPGKLSFNIYHSDDRDTLWSIAERFYGSGRYYPVILLHNPGLRTYNIKGGINIRILKEPAQVKAIYARLVKREGKR